MEINRLYNESNLVTMARIPDSFVDLTVTSPPYDNQRDYKDDIGKQWSFETSKPIIKELFRVTKDGGVVVWVVNDATINGSETGTSFKQALYFMECGFKLYDTLIWNKMAPAVPTESRYYDVFEYMFVMSKGKPKSCNLITDRINVSKEGTKYKKTSKNKKEGWIKREGVGVVGKLSRRFNIWNVVRNAKSLGHPAPFSEQLASDHIKSWSNEGDLIYDPFAGSGTTAKMARLLNRNWIASEISKEYCEIHKQRLEFNDLFN